MASACVPPLSLQLCQTQTTNSSYLFSYDDEQDDPTVFARSLSLLWQTQTEVLLLIHIRGKTLGSWYPAQQRQTSAKLKKPHSLFSKYMKGRFEGNSPSVHPSHFWVGFLKAWTVKIWRVWEVATQRVQLKMHGSSQRKDNQSLARWHKKGWRGLGENQWTGRPEKTGNQDNETMT